MTDRLSRWGADWNGHLGEWLGLALDQDDDEFDSLSAQFPTNALRDEFLDDVEDRDEETILRLLRRFMFDSCSFQGDERALAHMSDSRDAVGDRPLTGYERRLVAWQQGTIPGPHVGARWILDLLPSHPAQAIAALDAYVLSDWLYLPDGRINGLFDAMMVIRAFYIGNPNRTGAKTAFLLGLTPRDFEVLVHRLYEAMGYEATLTPSRADGGRDVVATLDELTRRQSVRVECKRYAGRVGVAVVRGLLGVVADEKATKGVLVTSGGFTRGAQHLALRNPSIELINGGELVTLLNEHLGYHWPTNIERLLSSRSGPV